MRTESPSRLLPCALIALLATGGCGERIPSQPERENQRPSVQLTRAPSRSGDLYSYSYEMRWTGYDPDGEVIRFLHAVDPPAPTAIDPVPDTAWVATTSFTEIFHFEATQPQPPEEGTPQLAADYHVFVLKAVDNRGLESAPVVVAFNSSTIAPVARIIDPSPSRQRLYLSPSFTVTWEGFDADGVTSLKPIYYRIKLITPSTPITPALMAQHPDTLIRYYQPRGWATWDSLGADVSSFSFSTLAPQQDYAFVIIAFDEAGAYTPYTHDDTNVLNFRALYANTAGPLLTIWNDFFSYTYTQGVYAPNDRRYEVFLEVPANIPVSFSWVATQEGTTIKHYRWVMDIENIEDNTARSNERTDWTHWSQPTFTTRSATVGPFPLSGDHRFYIEATDANGLRSLGVIHFQVVVGSFDKELAICDDTRLTLDRKTSASTTCIDRPLGRFPSAAELDTFLYARGGVPIKCYPAGSVSRAGVFQGYAYDTLNMRTFKLNPTPSLSLLSRYRHLVWLVNPAAIEIGTGFGFDPDITTMRYMNQSGHLNVLAAYLRQGGELWLAGGGSLGAAAMATNSSANDRPTRTFSAAAGELIPGRFVYDFAHWRSEFKPVSGLFQIRKNLGRLAGTGAYPMFPDQVLPKSLALGDTLPAWRTSSGDFYLTAFDLETLTLPNSVVEDFDPDPEREDLQSVLDTVFVASGGTLPPNSAVMTVYHGQDNARVIVTGFDLWSYSKSSIRPVIDGVLQGIWGLTRRGPSMAAPVAEGTGSGSGPPTQ